MIITATTKRLRVDYRAVGKFYNQNSEPDTGNRNDSATHSDYPFDSKDVEIGQTFTVPDSTWVQVKVYEPAADAPLDPQG